MAVIDNDYVESEIFAIFDEILAHKKRKEQEQAQQKLAGGNSPTVPTSEENGAWF